MNFEGTMQFAFRFLHERGSDSQKATRVQACRIAVMVQERVVCVSSVEFEIFFVFLLRFA
jgi:hypothetical protein